VAARGINHVSIPTRDLDESERFYKELVEAERLDSPNFGTPVRWLRVGNVQIHLLQDGGGGGGAGHFGITVDDLAAVYERARALDAFDSFANGYYLWELPDGVVQLYLRDPSGNLVEVNARDAGALPELVRAEVRALVEAQPQSEENLRARLFV
jgi:catechol 2,3-dioxygenase-like lactoylglutathione lyase family enzyme